MKKLILLTTLITVIGISPALFQYGYFMMASDYAKQIIPFIVETKRMLSSGEPFWSWNHCIGDNFIGSYSYYTLTSPFVWFTCIFPYKYIYMAITISLFLKMICLGITSLLYFKKMNISEELQIIGALMYAFSSYTVSNLFYYSFLEPMIVFPLLLISIECYLRREKYAHLYLAISSFLVFFINFYFVPCSLLSALIYAIFRIQSPDIHVGYNKIPLGIGLVLLGGMLSSIILMPTILHLIDGPRASERDYGLDSESFIYWSLERFRTVFMPKLLEEQNGMLKFSGYYSNAAYIPVAGIFFASLYVVRYKDWLKWLVLTLFVFYVTPLNGLFSLFTTPMYSRWAYSFTLIIILATLKYLDKSEHIRWAEFGYYTLLSICIVGLNYGLSYRKYHAAGKIFSDKDYIPNLIIIAFFAISLIVLSICLRRGNNKSFLLSCVVTFSSFYMATRVFMRTDFYEKWLGDNQRCYIHPYLINNMLDRGVDTFTYRTDFVTRTGNCFPNVCLLKNRASVATWSSVHNNVVSKLFSSIDDKMKSRGLGIVTITKNVQSYDALMSVKEIVVYNDSLRNGEQPRSVDRRIEYGEGYSIFENKYYIPMGFTYDTYISESQIDSLIGQDADIPLQLLSNLVVNEKDIPFVRQYLDEGGVIFHPSLDSLVNARKKNVCSTFIGDTRGFSASIKMKKDNFLFFSVPADNGFKAYIDNIETPILKVNLGLSAILVKKGNHDIRFSYIPYGLREGTIITLLSLFILIVIGWRVNHDRYNFNKTKLQRMS